MKVFLISDCHGNIDGLTRALEKKKIIDKHGNRQLDRRHQVISIGDLANCVSDSLQGDFDCLSLVGEIIDTMLIGNHEIPYLDSENTFSGFRHFPELQHKINSLLNEDLIGAGVLFDKTLITHAGLSRGILSIDMDANECFNQIESHWNDRNFNHSWFSSVGRSRGGNSNSGGILWCDFEDEFVPTNFPQICGHTPRGVRMKGNALCIDVGAKDQNTEPFILELA
jgi:Calcineurin-like phosphoesterase